MTETVPAPRALDRDAVLADYRTGWESRHASLIGRREVLTGKAKFGIFGDGKEVPQLAMARAFRPGDFRSGYYRDQTFMMAVGRLTLDEFFAQLYADADREREPASAGRQMNAHFATRTRDLDGAPVDLTAEPHSSADMSPTAGQMPRLVGLGYASRLYREIPGLAEATGQSRRGDEIAFGTIGNASCAEGHFWEALNAVGVLRAPVLISIWDDGYGISVPNEFQIAKGDLTDLLAGFQRRPGQEGGLDIYTAAGWDYPGLCETYVMAADLVRREQVPAVLHVREVTQPQGHSTSGSHERYKSAERLAWEAEHDGLRRMRSWILEQGIAEASELDRVETDAAESARAAQRRAWEAFQEPIRAEREAFVALAGRLAASARDRAAIDAAVARLGRLQPALRRHLQATAHELLLATLGDDSPARAELARWTADHLAANRERYGSHLHAPGGRSALAVDPVPAVYAEEARTVNGFEVLNACFDAALARMPELVAFGEDVGRLGDVNQGFLGLQEKYGALRVADTGIREQTIIGQAIGLALRGIRPIAEIQYLDYVLYGLQTLSDDLATLRWRTAGGQAAPVIVRTRGHRLEGIWHAGSPMGGLVHLVRGIWVCVPRDMTAAAGMYNTLLAGDDPAIVVEVLNGYRQKERLPANIGEFRVPLGVPETLREGTDLTIVTYGACCRIALEAADLLAKAGVEAEVVDVQTLLPFDREDRILASLRRTSRLLVLDEDVPGGASAFILQQVVERMGGFWWLDAAPVTVTAREHRPAYGSDGDYFSKPSREDVVRAAWAMVREADPKKRPDLGL
ncbi:MAG TPA: transketolase C-terminal domain-containing protein [Thermoanaerobaculia bacterium]|nr:transketolase C-terminal domain-containing protein [Thermoanaerobaculia bacterium]